MTRSKQPRNPVILLRCNTRKCLMADALNGVAALILVAGGGRARQCRSSYPPIERPFLGHQRLPAAVDLPVNTLSAQIPAFQFQASFRRTFPTGSDRQADRYRNPPLGVGAVSVGPWGLLYQSNKPACGGSRHGGSREASAAAPFSWRWVSIFSITTGSSMQAMVLTAPPQARRPAPPGGPSTIQMQVFPHGPIEQT